MDYLLVSQPQFQPIANTLIEYINSGRHVIVCSAPGTGQTTLTLEVLHQQKRVYFLLKPEMLAGLLSESTGAARIREELSRNQLVVVEEANQLSDEWIALLRRHLACPEDGCQLLLLTHTLTPFDTNTATDFTFKPDYVQVYVPFA